VSFSDENKRKFSEKGKKRPEFFQRPKPGRKTTPMDAQTGKIQVASVVVVAINVCNILTHACV